MANFKVVVSDPKSKKAFQKEIEQKASGFMGKKIGDKVKGDGLGLSGYEFQITGGSDAQGFPMRKDVEGIGRKKVLLTRGTGFKTKVRGLRKRKSVRGNTISSAISQLNAKIVAYGSTPIDQLVSSKKEKPKEMTEEEKKAALAAELQSKVSDEGPAKSRSDQILEEMEAKEKVKAEEPKSEKPEETKEEKPAEPEAKEEAADEKPAEETKAEPKEDKPSETKEDSEAKPEEPAKEKKAKPESDEKKD